MLPITPLVTISTNISVREDQQTQANASLSKLTVSVPRINCNSNLTPTCNNKKAGFPGFFVVINFSELLQSRFLAAIICSIIGPKISSMA